MRSGLIHGLCLVALSWGGGGCLPPGGGGGGELEIGTGEWAFVSVEDRGEIELVYGPQGGWHVWVSLQVGGLDPRRVEMELTTEIAGMPESRERSIVHVDLQPARDGRFVRYGWPAILSRPECAAGRELLVEVQLRDRIDVVAFDAFTVIPSAYDNVDRLGVCGLVSPSE